MSGEEESRWLRAQLNTRSSPYFTGSATPPIETLASIRPCTDALSSLEQRYARLLSMRLTYLARRVAGGDLTRRSGPAFIAMADVGGNAAPVSTFGPTQRLVTISAIPMEVHSFRFSRECLLPFIRLAHAAAASAGLVEPHALAHRRHAGFRALTTPGQITKTRQNSDLRSQRA